MTLPPTAFSPADLTTFLDTATTAALAAGAIQLARTDLLHEVRAKSTFSDLVTEVDALCEAEIRRIILAAYPAHAVLGEEEGQAGEGEYLWIVDPLDGTVNYARGYPVYCASVALEVRGVRVVGAVYDPSRRELFTASLGSGAFLNGARIQPSTTPRLQSPALISTGFPYSVADDASNLTYLGKLLALGVPVRRPGAAALDLCNVACGRMDGYWELGLKRWDSAAGSLIIEEAGGVVSDMDGLPTPYGPGIVAANPALHPELLTVLSGGVLGSSVRGSPDQPR
ncbi:inositol monophosphatase family protein [Deinococcus rubellus]|uniref:Inositol-1-monophosphatase n=1 Tax=Deinococcus rubellus TaxID=1889240 RepID=A0ABY5YLF3_9DEIO|nr:inositol monophosphatase family protein [Deinococcus rubellus]UWX65094.1 inositol monophosphatase [Deinococcus rubellus]